MKINRKIYEFIMANREKNISTLQKWYECEKAIQALKCEKDKLYKELRINS